MNEELEPLRSFILPGGGARRGRSSISPAPIVRRAERAAVAAARDVRSTRSRSPISTACRTICSCSRVGWRASEGGDILWQPGATR